MSTEFFRLPQTVWSVSPTTPIASYRACAADKSRVHIYQALTPAKYFLQKANPVLDTHARKARDAATALSDTADVVAARQHKHESRSRWYLHDTGIALFLSAVVDAPDDPRLPTNWETWDTNKINLASQSLASISETFSIGAALVNNVFFTISLDHDVMMEERRDLRLLERQAATLAEILADESGDRLCRWQEIDTVA